MSSYKNDETIQAFKKTAYYNQLIADPNLILLYVGGSRIVGVSDEQSDYDLCAIMKSTDHKSTTGVLQWRRGDAHLHIYNENLDQFFCTEDWYYAVGMLNQAYLTEEDILFANPQHEKLVKFIIENKKKVGIIGAYRLALTFERLIDRVLSLNYLDQQSLTKRLYHLLVSYSLLTNSPLDIDFVKKVKYCKTQPLNEADTQELILILQKFINYVSENPLDIELETQKILLAFSRLQDA